MCFSSQYLTSEIILCIYLPFAFFSGLYIPQGEKKLPPLLSIAKSLVLLGGQMVKNPPVIQETRVWSLGLEDPLEKKMATHSSILA